MFDSGLIFFFLVLFYMDYEWKRCESYLSAPPSNMWGATLTPIGHKLYLIGGYLLFLIF